jgi:hypothetical protein
MEGLACPVATGVLGGGPDGPGPVVLFASAPDTSKPARAPQSTLIARKTMTSIRASARQSLSTLRLGSISIQGQDRSVVPRSLNQAVI